MGTAEQTEIARLRRELAGRDEQIAFLERQVEVMAEVQELTRRERLEADETVHALERINVLASDEKREAENTIKAIAEVINMTAVEREEAQRMIEAQQQLEQLAEEELIARDRVIDSILKISTEIVSILDLDRLLDASLRYAVTLTGAERGYLYLADEGGVSLKSKLEPPGAALAGHHAHVRRAVGRVAASGKGEIAARRRLRFGGAARELSWICAPLTNRDALTGVLYVDTLAAGASFKNAHLTTIQIFCMQAGIAIENASLYHDLEGKVLDRTRELKGAYDKLNVAYGTIKTDLLLAQRIQQRLLPHPPARAGGLSLAVAYHPMTEVGGDFYDVSRLPGGATRVFLADATGHGVQAALATMLIKAIYERHKADAPDPGELVRRVNDEFLRDYKSLNMFFTCVVADVDPARGEVALASAGHPEQYLAHGGRVHAFRPTGRLVGLLEDSLYRVERHPFAPGDALLLFSDGLFEEFDAARREFGEARVKRAFSELSARPPRMVVARLLSAVKRFLGRAPINDDITIISIKHAGR